MAPKPDDFHVTGELFVSNPGVWAKLHVREPQGINPNILMLDLHLFQRPGMWPQVMTWAQCRYDITLSPSTPKYSDVDVLHDGTSIVSVKVDEVQ